MEYTKGQWKVTNINDASPFRIGAINANGIQGYDKHIAYVETRPNASLIAVAPDMYEALKALVDKLETLSLWDKTDNTYYAAKKILAKAEGK